MAAMDNICDSFKEAAVDAYAKAYKNGNPPSVTDALLRAILEQLDKLNEQVEALKPGKN
jgi:hypothetical protein